MDVNVKLDEEFYVQSISVSSYCKLSEVGSILIKLKQILIHSKNLYKFMEHYDIPPVDDIFGMVKIPDQEVIIFGNKSTIIADPNSPIHGIHKDEVIKHISAGIIIKKHMVVYVDERCNVIIDVVGLDDYMTNFSDPMAKTFSSKIMEDDHPLPYLQAIIPDFMRRLKEDFFIDEYAEKVENFLSGLIEKNEVIEFPLTFEMGKIRKDIISEERFRSVWRDIPSSEIVNGWVTGRTITDWYVEPEVRLAIESGWLLRGVPEFATDQNNVYYRLK